ncbi:MAG: hypothetical protein CMM50_15030 [Rhodospirillaceae bacterium]|nr:hypothetical protein [Rhodospirillaceae bacterium]
MNETQSKIDMNRDRISQVYLGQISDPETQEIARRRINWVARKVEGKRVLDIGCSEGILPILLARQGINAIGVDINFSAIEYANELRQSEPISVQNSLSFVHGDIHSLELPEDDNLFDTIVASEVLEHFAQPERTIPHILPLLKKDGLLIITTPFGFHPDPDHKTTFLLSNFLPLISSHFRPEELSVSDGYIRFSGRRDENPSTHWNKLFSHSQKITWIEEATLQSQKLLHDRLSTTKEQRRQITQSLDELKRQNLALINTLRSAEDVTALSINMRESLDSIKSELNEITDKTFSLAEKREVLLTEIRGNIGKSFQDSLDVLEGSLQSIHNDLPRLVSSKPITDLVEKLDQLGNRIRDEFLTGFGDATRQSAQFAHELRAAQTEIAALRKAEASARDSVDEVLAQRDQLSAELNAKVSELQAKTADLHLLQQAAQEAALERAELTRQLNDAENAAHSAENRAADAEWTLAETLAKLEDAERTAEDAAAARHEALARAVEAERLAAEAERSITEANRLAAEAERSAADAVDNARHSERLREDEKRSFQIKYHGLQVRLKNLETSHATSLAAIRQKHNEQLAKLRKNYGQLNTRYVKLSQAYEDIISSESFAIGRLGTSIVRNPLRLAAPSTMAELWRLLRRTPQLNSIRPSRAVQNTTTDDFYDTKMPIDDQRVELGSNLDHFATNVRALGSPAVVFMFSGTTYVQNVRANRPIRLTHQLLQRDIPVIFNYHRWRATEPWPAYDNGLLLQSPVDLTQEAFSQICDQSYGNTQKIFVISYPHPSIPKVMNRFLMNGWAVLYDCRDDWEEFSKVGQAKWYNPAVEKYIAYNADAVTCVSITLCEKMKKYTNPKKVHLLPNGSDPTFREPDYQNRPSTNPRVFGYFGHLTPSWFDWDALHEIARERPNYCFDLIGHSAPADLVHPENVRVLGPMDHTQINHVARNWTAALIPFKIGPLADAVDPIKIYEYLALDLPVVSFRMPQIHAYPATFIAHSVGEFCRALDKTVDMSVDWRSVSRFLSESTWEKRSEALLKLAAQSRSRESLSSFHMKNSENK